MEIPVFEYMRWAKAHGTSHRFDLSVSGMPALELPALAHPVANRQTPMGDGDVVCQGLIAKRYCVSADHVLFVPGTTLGCFLLTWALMERGAPVLVETPAYENLPGLVRLFGGRLIPLPRRPEEDYRLDPESVKRGLESGARLVLLTDLHNPTGVHLRDDDLEEVRALAERYGARVVVDEVYRDYLEGPPGTAYRADHDAVVVAASLTKVYGLGPLRTGWVICPPALRKRIAALLDYLTMLPPAATAAVAEQVLVDAERVRERSHQVSRRGLDIFDRWAAARDDVLWTPPAGGLNAFIGFAGIDDTGPLCEWLRVERETCIVPGSFFGDSSRVRLGFGVAPEVLEPGLERLAEAIARFR